MNKENKLGVVDSLILVWSVSWYCRPKGPRKLVDMDDTSGEMVKTEYINNFKKVIVCPRSLVHFHIAVVYAMSNISFFPIRPLN